MEEVELFIDPNIAAPAPLDRAIANTVLRSYSNRYSDGFDLEVSAFFGAERVTIVGEDLIFSAKLAIKRASVELHFKNCNASLLEINANDISDEWSVREIRRFDNSQTRDAAFGSKLSGNVKSSTDGSNADADMNVSAETRQAFGLKSGQELEASRTTQNWSMNSDSSILIGRMDQYLSGMELDGFRGWRVLPDLAAEYSAVISILSVRSDWIDFSEIEAVPTSGKLGEKVRRLFASKKEQKKAYFKLLLAELAARGLQTDNGSEDANLAVSMQVLRAENSDDVVVDVKPFAVSQHPDKRGIGVDSALVAEFLNRSTEEGREMLAGLGVSQSKLAEVDAQYVHQKKSTRGLFTAGSTPIRAIEALRIFRANSGELTISEADRLLPSKTRTDLVNLGVLKVQSQKIYADDMSDRSEEEEIRFAAVKAPTLLTARRILVGKPSATAIEIIDAISFEHGKDYTTEGSKIRVGNALKRWCFWLEPHLIDPDGGSTSEMLKIAATSNQAGRGRTSIATPENLAIAQRGLDEGLSKPEIAKKFGVATNTVYIWIRKGLLVER